MKLYLDGALDPAAALDVTAGTGSEVTGVGYLAVGAGGTALSGAVDVDFLRFAAGENAPADSAYPPPPGGWAYAYEANAGDDQTPDAAALDGTWNHNNGSDAWDLSGVGGTLGSANKPGGVMIVGDGGASWLRIQDAGNPTKYPVPGGSGNYTDPSNRKLYFYHDLAAHGAPSTILDGGVTLYFRVRVPTDEPIDPLHPDSPIGIVPYPAGGDGYAIHDNGKGSIGIKQAAGGIISFSLATQAESGAGELLTNNLNGKVPSADVDTGEAGTRNAVPLDTTSWHDVWVTVSKGTGSTGPSASVEVLAFAPPVNLACVQRDADVDLTWENPAVYSGIRIFRNGRLVGEVGGTETAYTDSGAPAGDLVYQVIPCLGGICADTPELGTHVAKVYLDGAVEPAAIFDVTAGTGQEYAGSYLALGLGSTADSGALDLDFVRIARGTNAPAGPSYPPPAGGWAYAYEANVGEDSPGVDPGVGALDGTWNHDNGSDAWDGSPVGGELGPANQPGGAGIVEGLDATYLRIQDPGDPRDYGLPDPSNRKIYFGRDLAGEEFGANFIDDGVTLYFRARVPTDDPIDPLYPDGGGGIAPYPAEGDGYTIHNDGKGCIGVRQAAGGIISFSLATGAETGSGALVANAQNGRSLSADVDPGEGGVTNEIELDPTQWHDVWVVVSAGTGLSGPTCALKVCPLEGDTRCLGLELAQLGKTPAVLATATAEDDSGDAIIYTFVATKEGEDPVVVGPQSEATATLELSAGEWTVAVTVDDDPDCDDPPGRCSETIVVVECPLEGDTRCLGLELAQLGKTPAVLATATAEDDSGDAIIYTFVATKEGEDPVVVGPQSEATATLELSAGEWTVAVTVDDDPDCDDPPGRCSETIVVVECPLEGDTRCLGLELAQLGKTPAVLATATAEDDSGDAIIYTFVATKEGEDPVVVGPQSEATATLELSAGEWTVAVTVDDDPDCDDPPGRCSETIAVEEPGGLQKPSDLNQDARFDLADAIALLGHLFRGEFRTLPCGDGTLRDPAVIALLDVNGDGRVDLSDAVWNLNYLFRGGPRPRSCLDETCPCFRIVGCPDRCQ